MFTTDGQMENLDFDLSQKHVSYKGVTFAWKDKHASELMK